MRSRMMVLSIAVLLTACADGPAGLEPSGRFALSVAAGDAQQAVVGRQLPEAVIVSVVDAESRQAAQATVVNWFRISGNDTVFSGAALTNAEGRTQFMWTLLPKAGPQKLTAWALDNNGTRVSFVTATADGLHDRAAAVAAQPGLVHWRGDTVQASTLVTAVVDQYGNPVTSPVVTVDSGAAWHAVNTTAVAWTRIGIHNVRVLSDTAAGVAAVTVLRDLRKLVGWQLAYTCGDTSLVFPTRSWDYMAASGTIDSVQYRTLAGREWTIFATTAWRRHSDRPDDVEWDTTTVATERLVVTEQVAATGGLRIAYREALIPGTTTRIHRSDFAESNPLPWANDEPAFSGGNACRFAWNPTEPFTPLTLTPPL